MSILFGGGKSAPSKPSYTGLQIQTSSNALPVPLAWGLTRMAPNLVWYNDFKAIPHKQKQGGKGGSQSSVTYTYSASLIMGLCEGEIEDVFKVWKNNALDADFGIAGFTLFDGSDPQATWGYVTTSHPTEALGYNGLAYLAAANYDLGDSASLPNHTFEVACKFYDTQEGGNGDADPALVTDDLLTNQRYGVLFPETAIDYNTLLSSIDAPTTGDSSYQTYCQAMGFGLSPVLVDSEQSSDIVERWMKITNTAVFWSGAALKFVPYGDSVIEANGVKYLPPTEVRYDLTDKDFEFEDGQDPVLVERSDPADAFNAFRVITRDRDNAYNLKPNNAKDPASIDMLGLRTADDLKAEEICETEMGSKVAYLLLQRMVYIRNKYRFKLSWEFVRLEPMDIVTLTDGAFLDHVPVRITDLEEDDDGFLTFVAEDYFQGVSSAGNYPVQPVINHPQDAGAAPSDVNPPVIFEPPAALTNGNPQVWVGVSGGVAGVADPNWGGTLIWASTDGSSYSQIGNVDSPTRMGLLDDILPAFMGTNPDTTNVLDVDLAMSDGELSSTTTTDAENAVTLCYVDGEFLSYEIATLVSGHEYELTNLYRGLYGSTPGAHSAGTDFVRIDETVFQFTLPESYVGVEVFLKFTSYNIFGGKTQSLADVTAYTFTPAGVAFDVIPPANVTITPQPAVQPDGTTSLSLFIDWDPSTDSLLNTYEVQYVKDGDTNWQGSSTSKDQSQWGSPGGIIPEEDYVARVRAVRTSGVQAFSDWIESAPTNSGPLSGGAPYVIFTPVTGFTYNIADGTNTVLFTPAGTLASGTVVLPPNPTDGLRVYVSTDKEITALTVNANVGQTITTPPTTLLPGLGFGYLYNESATTWYRLY